MFRAFIVVLCSMFLTGFLHAAPAKNVIWIIGDGMGPELMGFFMQGVRYGKLQGYEEPVSNMERLMQEGTYGLYFTNTARTIVTDSAAAATQMATGTPTLPQRIGVDENGQAVQTLLEWAQQRGKATGIISDAYVTDATPAGFTAHVPDRKQKYEIARQQIAGNFDVILGGGRKYFTKKENKNLLRQAKKQGYQVVETARALTRVKKGKLLGLFAQQDLPMAVEMSRYPHVPSLTAQTQKAVEVLAQHPNGFVLMVEAGKIDWAAHANDTGAVLAELKNLDSVLAFVREYAATHPDTLVYVNADHDTGLGAFVYRSLDGEEAARRTARGEVLYSQNRKDYGNFAVYQTLEKQTRSLYKLYVRLKALPAAQLTAAYVEAQLREALGYPVSLGEFDNPTDLEGLFAQINARYNFAWATQTHSASPLIGIAYGPGAELFGGVYHNTDILVRLQQALSN